MLTFRAHDEWFVIAHLREVISVVSYTQDDLSIGLKASLNVIN